MNGDYRPPDRGIHPPAFAPINWQALKDPAGYHGATDELIDRALAEARIQEND